MRTSALTETVLSFPVTTLTLADGVSLAQSWIRSRERLRYIVCANPHSLVTARRDDLFSLALRESDLVLPDGIGIVLASRAFRGAIRTRIAGSDMFLGLCRALQDEGRRSVFFLGASASTLKTIREKMRREFPRISVVGTYAPPFESSFTPDENQRMVDAVNAARPDVLFVGMTAPKQEKWLHANRGKLDVPLALAIGAVFDFFSGRIRRPHPVFQRAGLEWLPRLLQEPRRLWRRNLVSSPIFLWHVVFERLMR